MIITISGASGSGKTTIAKELLKRVSGSQMVVSHTTREKRDSDLIVEYSYIGAEDFNHLKENGDFLWSVYIHGIYYGTTRQSVLAAQHLNSVHIMLLKPSVIGILRDFAKKEGIDVKSFYILSPGPIVLRQRLVGRGDHEEAIERRISDCLRWEAEAKSSDVSYIFVHNDGPILNAVIQMVQLL